MPDQKVPFTLREIVRPEELHRSSVSSRMPLEKRPTKRCRSRQNSPSLTNRLGFRRQAMLNGPRHWTKLCQQGSPGNRVSVNIQSFMGFAVYPNPPCLSDRFLELQQQTQVSAAYSFRQAYFRQCSRRDRGSIHYHRLGLQHQDKQHVPGHLFQR